MSNKSSASSGSRTSVRITLPIDLYDALLEIAGELNSHVEVKSLVIQAVMEYIERRGRESLSGFSENTFPKDGLVDAKEISLSYLQQVKEDLEERESPLIPSALMESASFLFDDI